MTSPSRSTIASNVYQTTTLTLNALIAGHKWGGFAGSAALLSYSFPWTSSSTATFAGRFGTGDYSLLGEHKASSHYGLDATQQTAARGALNAWTNVARVTLSEVAESSSNVGDIRFAWTSSVSPSGSVGMAWGWAYGPDGYSPSAGDIWLDALADGAFDPDWSAGSYNFNGLLHEIGHALGLKHSFEEGPTLPGSLDSQQYTVMSYADHPHSLFGWVSKNGDGSYFWNLRSVQPDTPMLYDIAAMQYMYGANLNYKTGNDFYTFDPATPFFRTIWDAGGSDTISVANFTKACEIDLQAGHFSKITIESDSPNAYVWDGPVIQPTYDGTDNLAIAFGVVIENAIGGSGDDTLIGNDSSNNLDGGAGNDTFDGGPGNDVLIGSIGYDFAVFGGARSQYVITRTDTGYAISGPDGVDLLTDIESARFDDQNVPLTNSQPNRLPTGTVTITGSATQWQTLRATNTLADVDGLGTISYQWQAAGVNIANATSSVFTLGQAEVGKAIAVVARYTDGLGNVETVTALSTVAVAGMGTIALTPTKAWTQLVGGTGNNEGYALTTGLDGSIFVGGFTQGSLNGQRAGGDGDAFLTKYSADGATVWTRLLGCTDLGVAQALTTGLDSSIYVGGMALGTVDGQTYAGFGDAFLTKYSADGAKSWTRLLGTSGVDLAQALTTGLDGCIFVGGNTAGALDGQPHGGGSDAFVAKYSVGGDKVWTRQIGGVGADRATDLTTGLDGAIYVVGDTVGALDGQSNVGLEDAFITKFAADGTKVWTRLLGTAGDDQALAVTTGIDGSIYVGGHAHGSLNGQAALGGDDAFLIKYSPEGTVLWTRLFGSSGRDVAQALTMGIDGSIYVSGLTEGSSDGQTHRGGSDAFLTKFSVDGTKAWTRLLGSTSDESADALTTGLDGSIFVGGTTDGPLDGQTALGGEDAFLARFQVVSYPPELGTSGAERFASRVGTQSIDGGAGLDTMVYTSTRAEHKVAMSMIGYAVTNIASGDVDSLESVERLEFADGRIALDMFKGQSGSNTALLIGAVLGHDALVSTKSLVGAVIDLFDQGMTLQQLSGAAMRLPIWGPLTNGSATASNTEIASYLLKTVNGAAPDAQTLSAAVASLDTETGATQGNFLWHLAESEANQVQVDLVGLMQTGLEFAP